MKFKQIWGLVLLFFIIFIHSAQAQSDITLLITEVFYDTPGQESEEEWIEIANVGTAVINLSNIKIGDEETTGGQEGMKRFPEDAAIEPGQVVVVAQTAVGFRRLYGFNPDYEISDSDEAVPDMRRYLLWASGDVAIANDGDEVLLLDGDGVIIDGLNYGDSNYFFTPAIADVVAGVSLERNPANCDSDSAADWQPQTQPTPGVITLDDACRQPVNPAELEDLPAIGEIQGTGDVSPFINQIVSFRGVVTGSYENQNASGVIFYTLFVQDLVGFEDGDPATSDGIAVFLGRQRPSTPIGDQLRLTGQVTEFFGYTEIDDNDLEILIEAHDVPLPAPVPIDPPADNAAQATYFEPLESMLVSIEGEADVVGATFSGCSFAVVRDGLGQVLRQSITDPIGQVMPILHTSDVDCGTFPHLKAGDSVTGIVGQLIYNFDLFRIVQQGDLQVTASPFAPIPAPPTTTADQLTIATFNVENHFDTIDDTGDEAEPKPTADEIASKQTKLAYAIGHTLGCPTLIGIQEIEKASLLQDLAAEAAAACGFTYTVTHLESVDVRGIDVALMSDPGRVTVQSAQLRQGCTTINTGIVDDSVACPTGQQPLFSRPPLQVTVVVAERPFTLLINHFKSKREGEAETAPRRIAQAQHLNAIVAELLAANGEAQVVVMGDFNDYEVSRPLQTMTEANLTNVLAQVPLTERYSFIFSGAAQLLDGILVSPALVDNVVDVQIFHVNAGYPDSLAEDVSETGLPYHATDHDLPLLVLRLDNLPEPTAVPPTPTTPIEPTSTIQPTAVPPPPEPAGSLPWEWVAGGFMAITAVITAFFLAKRRT
jgi:predicted extracellular nuclease